MIKPRPTSVRIIAPERSPMRRARRLLVPVFAFLPAPLAAQISDITWDAPEMVDAPVTDVSSGSGVSVIDVFGDWHLVYEKNGDVHHRVRTSAGWQPATQLSNDPASSTNPHIAFETSFIHVVWEDDRTGHAEVWRRTYVLNTGWLTEACVTCDASPSSQPRPRVARRRDVCVGSPRRGRSLRRERNLLRGR